MVATSTELLEQAIHQHAPLSRKGLMERLFTAWFGGWVYNQIWEDPRVDAQALQIGPESRILTISSAGCNVLNYLIHKPASIVTVDLNAAHMHLTRLKVVAAQQLPDYEAFFNFFAVGKAKTNLGLYQRCIRPHLPEETRKFWDGGMPGRPRIHSFKSGLYNQAKFGLLMRVLHGCAKVIRRDPGALLKARTLEEQEQIFHQQIEPLFDNRLVRLGSRIPLVMYSLGIPPQQFEHVRNEGNVTDMYLRRLRRLACDFPVGDNYFAWQAFARHYDLKDRRALPDYLQEEHYATVRAGADRVETRMTSLTRALYEAKPDSFNGFVFLDAQDWMQPHQLEELWTLVALKGQSGSRIIFRTGAAASPIETALTPALRARFKYHETMSQELYQQDRSAIYGGFHVYTLS